MEIVKYSCELQQDTAESYKPKAISKYSCKLQANTTASGTPQGSSATHGIPFSNFQIC
jgi:hypothetical protein